MDPAMAMSSGSKGLAILLFTGVAAPLAGLLLRRVAAGWDSIGKGPLALEEPAPAGEDEDPELVAEEVRQLRDLVGSRR